MELAAFWTVFAIVVGVAAAGRGRSGLGWFLLGMLLSPLLAAILLALLPRLEMEPTNEPSPDTHVRCPDCRELILKGARVCKHCGCRLIPQDEPTA